VSKPEQQNFVHYEWVKNIDESSLKLCDKGFVDSFFKELESDLIYSGKINGRDVYFYVITELQSTVDYTMPYRVFKYISAILIREFENTPKDERERAGFRLPIVIPILFYNGEEKWTVPRNFKEYLQDGDLFEDVIDFCYILVDINELDKRYLIGNHDAICATIAVDKVDGYDFKQLTDVVVEISGAKYDFDNDEFKDFIGWLKHTLIHRVKSEDEADKIIDLIKEGDESKMRTGIDRLFDAAESRGEARGEARGIIKSALLLIESGMSIQEVSERLKLSNEQVEQVVGV
jgi:predicted transposase/invertase (TIGR01784 family)